MSKLQEEIKRKSDEFCHNKCGAPDDECKGCYAFSEWYSKKYGWLDYEDDDDGEDFSPEPEEELKSWERAQADAAGEWY